MPYTRPELEISLSAEQKDTVQGVLESLDSAWLKDKDFLAGTQEHSIADILAYEEVAQAYMTSVLDLGEYPNIQKWVERMKLVPHHDAAHASLTALGSLVPNDGNDTPMMKRLGGATKEGMKAFKDAQASF